MARSSYLSEELEAGASRVFNTLARSQEILKEEGGGNDLLFQTSALNKSVVIKEVATASTFDGEAGRTLTKLFFPYNEAHPHEGGASIYVEDSLLERILREDYGFDRDRFPEAVARDRAILECFRNLPTLDPFLVKDKFQMEEIRANPAYLQIERREERAIQAHIMKRFRTMVDFAFGDEDAQTSRGEERLKRLVRKLWNLDDLSELRPIVEALDLPQDQAAEILYSWKGILFYDFRARHMQKQVDNLLHYLRHHAKPVDAASRGQLQALAELRDSVLKELARNWAGANKTLQNYNTAYDHLFRHRKGPKPFIDFMRNARSHFWTLGQSLSRAEHGVELWRLTMERIVDGDGLHYDPLMELLNALLQIQRGR